MNEENYQIIKFRDNKKIYIPLKTWDNLMEITRKTLDSFPWMHIQVHVYGNKRVGKTIYLIKSMMEQYRILYGYDEEMAFHEVMKRTYFTIREFINDFKKLQDNNLYIPSCHVDDAGSGFSKHMWNKKGGRVLAQDLNSFIQTIGTEVIGLYFSSPGVDDTLSFLQSYEARIIHIISNREKMKPWERIAKIYRWNILPSGTARIDTVVDEDPFSCFLKKKYFDIYWALRRTYASKNLDKVDEAEKQLNQLNITQKTERKILKIISERFGVIADTI